MFKITLLLIISVIIITVMYTFKISFSMYMQYKVLIVRHLSLIISYTYVLLIIYFT